MASFGGKVEVITMHLFYLEWISKLMNFLHECIDASHIIFCLLMVLKLQILGLLLKLKPLLLCQLIDPFRFDQVVERENLLMRILIFEYVEVFILK